LFSEKPGFFQTKTQSPPFPQVFLGVLLVCGFVDFFNLFISDAFQLVTKMETGLAFFQAKS